MFIYIILTYHPITKFYNTVKNTFTNAFLMSIRHLPYTILMIVVSLVPLAVFFIPSAQLQSTILMVLFLLGFSTVAYSNSHFLVKIFDNYIPKEEEGEAQDDVSGKLTDSGEAL